MPSMLERGLSKAQQSHGHHHHHLHSPHKQGIPASAVVAEPAVPIPAILAPSPVELAQRAAATGCENTGSGCETTSGTNIQLPIGIGIA